MTVAGGPSKPTITLVNAASVLSSASVSGSVDATGARYALIEWEASTGDSITMEVYASGTTDDTSNGYYYEEVTRDTLGPLGAASPGRAMLVNLGRAVGRLVVKLTNAGAGTTTLSAWVTFGV